MSKIKRIQWGDITPPNDKVHYDHIIGVSSIGEFLITWKSWKEYPLYTVEISGYHKEPYIGTGRDLEDAKTIAQEFLDDVISECLDSED